MIYKGNQEKQEEANRHFCLAKSIYEEYFPNSLSHAVCLYNLGMQYLSWDKKDQGISHLMQARDILEENYSETLEYATCLHNLGAFLAETQRDEATRCLRNAHTVYVTYFPEAPEFISCTKKLIEIYRSDENAEAAEAEINAVVQASARILRQASIHQDNQWGQLEAVISSSLPSIGNSTLNQADRLQSEGDIHFAKKQFKKAEQCYRKALRISEPDTPNTKYADLLTSLGVLYAKTKRKEQAEDHFKRAYEIFQSEPDSFEKARCFYHYGSLHATEAEAKWYLDTEIYLSKHYPCSFEYAGSLYYRGFIFWEKKEFSQAGEYFRLASRIFSAGNYHSEEYAHSLYYYSVICWYWQRYALKLYLPLDTSILLLKKFRLTSCYQP